MTFGLLSQILAWGGWLGLLVALGGGVATLLARRAPPMWFWFVVPLVVSWGAWLGLGELPEAAEQPYAWALWQVICDQLWPMMLAGSLHGLVLFHPALRKQSRYQSASLVLPSAFLFLAGLLLTLVSASLVEADLRVEQQLAGVTLGALVPCLLCGVRSEDPDWLAARGRVVALYGLSVLFVMLDLHYLRLVFLGNAAAGLSVDETRIAGFQTLLAPVGALGLGAAMLCAGQSWRSALGAGLWALPVLLPPLLWESAHRDELWAGLPQELRHLQLEVPSVQEADGRWPDGLHLAMHPCRAQISDGHRQILAEDEPCSGWLLYADQDLPVRELLTLKPAGPFHLLVRGGAAPVPEAGYRMLAFDLGQAGLLRAMGQPGLTVGQIVAACDPKGGICPVSSP